MGQIGVVLAGGNALRMGGGDKSLRPLRGKPILDHVLERFRPQVDFLALSANGDPSRFAAWKVPVIADSVLDAGPLAGILAGMEWARQNYPDAERIASVPADTPFLPRDLVARLHEARDRSGADIAVATSGGRNHYLSALWPIGLIADLRKKLSTATDLRVGAFAQSYSVIGVEFLSREFDLFLNINHPEDIVRADCGAF